MERRRSMIPVLYRALLDVDRLREEVRGLAAELADAAAFHSRLDAAEQLAVHLLIRAETGARMTGH